MFEMYILSTFTGIGKTYLASKFRTKMKSFGDNYDFIGIGGVDEFIYFDEESFCSQFLLSEAGYGLIKEVVYDFVNNIPQGSRKDTNDFHELKNYSKVLYVTNNACSDAFEEMIMVLPEKFEEYYDFRLATCELDHWIHQADPIVLAAQWEEQMKLASEHDIPLILLNAEEYLEDVLADVFLICKQIGDKSNGVK